MERRPPAAARLGRACLAILCGACAVAGAGARAGRAPAGTLVLDLADPVVRVTVAGVPLRLRVDPDQRDGIELNEAIAARLGLPFEAGAIDEVGRVPVPSRVAAASFVIDARTVATALATHGTCCAGVDGSIGPAALPYALVRLVRAGAGGGRSLSFTMRRDGDNGYEAREAVGRATVRLRFSLMAAETLATASAGAILAQARGGRMQGATQPAVVAFGIARPTRLLVLDRPITLAGFRFAAVRTRTADLGGRRALPADPARDGDIVVRRRVRPQHEWAAIVIGRDRLDRCGEIRFARPTATLTLICADA